jgi:hypothetical protein
MRENEHRILCPQKFAVSYTTMCVCPPATMCVSPTEGSQYIPSSFFIKFFLFSFFLSGTQEGRTGGLIRFDQFRVQNLPRPEALVDAQRLVPFGAAALAPPRQSGATVQGRRGEERRERASRDRRGARGGEGGGGRGRGERGGEGGREAGPAWEKWALLFCTVNQREQALALRSSVNPLAVVMVAVGPEHDALAVRDAVAELTLVYLPVQNEGAGTALAIDAPVLEPPDVLFAPLERLRVRHGPRPGVSAVPVQPAAVEAALPPLLVRSNNIFAKKGKFWSRKRAKKIKEKQGNQNFTKESEKIVIRKLGYRKDSYSKTGVQKR